MEQTDLQKGEPANPFRCPRCGAEEMTVIEIVPGSEGALWRFLCNFCLYEEAVPEAELRRG